MERMSVDEILSHLDRMYPDAHCELNHANAYEMAIAVILSAQTTDVSVNKITPKLFDKYPTPQKLAKADQEDVIEIIKTIGMYKTKSANIINLGRILTEQYNGRVPGDYDSLISLPGVGRKTANVVLSVGFGQQRIAVDTHVFRVTNRIGLVHENDVLATELALMEILPEERWSEAHHSFIFHGRNCCTARKPHCGECPLRGLCESEERN